MRRLKKKKSRKWYNPKIVKRVALNPVFSQGCDFSDPNCKEGGGVLKS